MLALGIIPRETVKPESAEPDVKSATEPERFWVVGVGVAAGVFVGIGVAIGVLGVTGVFVAIGGIGPPPPPEPPPPLHAASVIPVRIIPTNTIFLLTFARNIVSCLLNPSGLHLSKHAHSTSRKDYKPILSLFYPHNEKPGKKVA